MAFDGLVIGAIVKQLSRELTGGRIEKIYHPEGEQLLLQVNSKTGRHSLMISAASNHPGAYLTTGWKGSNPQNPSGFCMLLRKHFQGGKISSIEQLESERIIEILVDSTNELGIRSPGKLIIEIMGKHSNITALNPDNNKIIDSIKRISSGINRYRQLLPGLPYVYPPGRGKVSFYSLSEDTLRQILEGSTLGRSDFTPSENEDRRQIISRLLISGIQGISPVFAEEIILRAEATASPHNATIMDYLNAIDFFSEGILTEKIFPRVYVGKGNTIDEFHVFPLSGYEQTHRTITFPHISAAVDYYYTNKDTTNRLRQKSGDLNRAINDLLSKHYLKKQRLKEDILDAENSHIYRLYGELLAASLHTIEQGASKAHVLNYYDNQIIEIPLDPRISPARNMQKYFKKFGKAKTAIKEKKSQLTQTNDAIDYLESMLTFGENATEIEEIEEIKQELVEVGYLRKRKDNYKAGKAKLNPLIFTTKDGFKIMVGRNNKENDKLTFKMADKKDLWLHAKDIPGSHVILLTQGKTPSASAINEAASLAAYYSKSRNSENVPVDYTQIRYVKKPSGAKPGMVIFTDNKTLFVSPKSGI
ncbi:MAG: Rqc2 family fibronectin-binding protein [Anaerovoracaceae bacterium]